MSTRRRIALLYAAPLLVAVGVFGFCATSFKDHRVKQGSAYGFTIGQSPGEALTAARQLLRDGDVSEFQLGHGSGAFAADLTVHDPATYPKWQLVVDPGMWVDTIYLTFENDQLVEIWRFRTRFELP